MNNRAELVLKITFVMSVINYSLWSYIEDWIGIKVFYYGNAASYVGYLYVIYEYTRILYKQNNKFSELITWSEIALASAVSNLADELFFDPTELSINEYVGFLLIIIMAVYNDHKRKRSNRNT